MDLIHTNVELKALNSWQVGGRAEFFAEPVSLEQLKDVVAWAKTKGIVVTVIGGGTNVLISDLGIQGLVIALRRLTQIKSGIDQQNFFIECLCGTSKSELLKIYIKNKLPPALFLAGLPGDVGGGVVMNAGVSESIRPREFGEIVEWVEVLRPDLSIQRLQARDLKWSYRHCEGWRPGIITKIRLVWPNLQDATMLEQVKQANQNRLSRQPLDLPSCGSTFVNPPGLKAGQLIEACDLKGFRIGGAEVSKKHANFIVNTGGACATDIDAIIRHVKKTVLEQRHVHLQTEVVYLGRWA